MKKKNKQKTPDSPKIERGLVQMIMMGKSIRKCGVSRTIYSKQPRMSSLVPKF